MHYNLDELWTDIPFWLGGSNYDTFGFLVDSDPMATASINHMQMQQTFDLRQEPCTAGMDGSNSIASNPLALDLYTMSMSLFPDTHSIGSSGTNTLMMAPSSSTPLPLMAQAKMEQQQQQRRRVKSLPSSHEDCIPRQQQPRFKDDQYSPKWVRYSGQLKEGYCDTCPEGRWLQLKNSAYWYHKQFYHGISSVTGRPFAEPLQQRVGPDGVLQGLCHQCICYVPICNGKKRRNSLLWYKHAHKCHAYTKPEKFPSPF